MRAAPVGLVHLGDPYRIYRDSLLQSVVTHRDSMAIAAAACQAYAVSRATIAPPGSLASLESRVAFSTDLAVLLDALERPGYELRGGRGALSLYGRIGIELPRYLREGKVPFDDWHNGAYVLESLPCALWCFLANPDDFEATLFAAVDAGHDADTVAAMAAHSLAPTKATLASRSASSPNWSFTTVSSNWPTTFMRSIEGSTKLPDRTRRQPARSGDRRCSEG
jgi:ADP-ribosylglycohydrolase